MSFGRQTDDSAKTYDLSARFNAFDSPYLTPAFSWKTQANRPNWKQNAWQLLVADSEESMHSNQGNIDYASTGVFATR